MVPTRFSHGASIAGSAPRLLAEAAGITQPYLSQIESGKRDGTIGTMKKIAEALKVTVDELV